MGDVYMVNGKILSGLPNHAKDIEFDNDGTTLSSTNTEDAIKEVNSNLTNLKSEKTLISYQSAPTTETSYPIDITGYSKICIEVGWYNGNISGTYLFPVSALPLTIFDVWLNNNPGASLLNYLEVQSVTTTSISVKGTDSNVFFKVVAMN